MISLSAHPPEALEELAAMFRAMALALADPAIRSDLLNKAEELEAKARQQRAERVNAKS